MPAILPVPVQAPPGETLTMQPIDLQERFGKRYQIARDEAHKPRGKIDPWLLLIPCRYGHILSLIHI